MHRLVELESCARSHLDNKEYEKAIETYQAFLSESPNWEQGQGHYELGLCFGYSGDSQQALQHFEEAIGQRPHDPMYWFGYADLAADAGDAQRALAYYCELLNCQYSTMWISEKNRTLTLNKLKTIKSRLDWKDESIRSYLIERVLDPSVLQTILEAI